MYVPRPYFSSSAHQTTSSVVTSERINCNGVVILAVVSFISLFKLQRTDHHFMYFCQNKFCSTRKRKHFEFQKWWITSCGSVWASASYKVEMKIDKYVDPCTAHLLFASITVQLSSSHLRRYEHWTTPSTRFWEYCARFSRTDGDERGDGREKNKAKVSSSHEKFH